MGEHNGRHPLLNIVVDIVVLVNAVVVSLELDGVPSFRIGLDGFGGAADNAVSFTTTVTTVTTTTLTGTVGPVSPIFQYAMYGICGFYLAEMAVQIAYYRTAFLQLPMTWAELPIVLVASVGAFLPEDILDGQVRKLWRLSVLRLFRCLRVWKLAAKYSSLRDLWLVLVGMGHAASAIIWLLVVLLVCIYACAGAATGMSFLSMRDQEDCSEEMIASGECLDKEMYFGSMAKSGLTLFQCITLDGWAEKVVRPLWSTNPITATSLSVFSVAMAYGLVSVAIGVLVWSTVNLARRHGSHSSQVEMARDFEVIGGLRKFFDKSLLLDGRKMIGRREFQEAMSVSFVQRAIEKLDLPCETPEGLFQHLDRDRCGEMTPQEFQGRLETMKRPANRFDIACLTASIGGSVTYVNRMETRTDTLLTELRDLKVRMRRSFAELNHLTRTDQDSGQVPEVVLRKAERIFNPVPPGSPRFTR